MDPIKRSPALKIMNIGMSHEELKANIQSPASASPISQNESDQDRKKRWLQKLDELIHEYTTKEKDRFWVDLEGVEFEGTIKEAILRHEKIAACQLNGKIVTITLYKASTSFVDDDTIDDVQELVAAPKKGITASPPMGTIEEVEENGSD